MTRALVAIGVLLTLAGCSKKKVVSSGPVMVTTPPTPQPAKRTRRVPQTAADEATTPPVLESMRTPEERRDAQAQINVDLARAEANLNSLRSRQLASESLRDLQRVESFIRLARASKDLSTAREYARRAEVLSTDLLNR